MQKFRKMWTKTTEIRLIIHKILNLVNSLKKAKIKSFEFFVVRWTVSQLSKMNISIGQKIDWTKITFEYIVPPPLPTELGRNNQLRVSGIRFFQLI